eukprot:4932725-Amphidinium_carterae.1
MASLLPPSRCASHAATTGKHTKATLSNVQDALSSPCKHFANALNLCGSSWRGCDGPSGQCRM